MKKILYITAVIFTAFIGMKLYSYKEESTHIKNCPENTNHLSDTKKHIFNAEGYSSLNEDDKDLWKYYSNNAMLKNSPTYIITPTPDKTSQATHPDMLYFSQGFNGYKYWLACTPYAFSNDRLEDPIILVSNDGKKFIPPPGEHNPIAGTPDDYKIGGHLSDTDIMYNGKEFILHYVYNRRGVLGPSKFFRMTSTDGIHWSKPQLVFLALDTKEGYSPAFVLQKNAIKMWYVGGEGKFVFTQSYDNEKTWNKVSSCVINMGAWRPWHVDIIQTDSGYEGLMCARLPKINTRALFYIRSSDGVNWLSSRNPLLFPSKKGWDNVEIYRSTMIKNNNIYKIWYSARGKKQKWHIGYTEIPSYKIKAAFPS